MKFKEKAKKFYEDHEEAIKLNGIGLAWAFVATVCSITSVAYYMDTHGFKVEIPALDPIYDLLEKQG